jgi:hypothetical protein
MNDALKEFLNSGKRIITDTKLPKAKETKKQPTLESITPQSNDPHHNFIKRVIQNKPKKAEILEDFMKFVDLAEKDL